MSFSAKSVVILSRNAKVQAITQKISHDIKQKLKESKDVKSVVA